MLIDIKRSPQAHSWYGIPIRKPSHFLKMQMKNLNEIRFDRMRTDDYAGNSFPAGFGEVQEIKPHELFVIQYHINCHRLRLDIFWAKQAEWTELVSCWYKLYVLLEFYPEKCTPRFKWNTFPIQSHLDNHSLMLWVTSSVKWINWSIFPPAQKTVTVCFLSLLF